jgi:hypothetical protein
MSDAANESLVHRFYEELWNDWRLEVADEIVSATVAFRGSLVRLTWTGTHTGPLGQIAPTGRRVSYVGAAFFRIADAMIDQAWVVGDTQELWRAIGRLTPSALDTSRGRARPLW